MLALKYGTSWRVIIGSSFAPYPVPATKIGRCQPEAKSDSESDDRIASASTGQACPGPLVAFRKERAGAGARYRTPLAEHTRALSCRCQDKETVDRIPGL